MFTLEEIKIANATARAAGASALNKDGTPRAIVPRYVAEHAPKTARILDFGAGFAALHTVTLRGLGFESVTAYEFGSNVRPGLHDREALSRRYDVVFASNVLNVQSSPEMLAETLSQMSAALLPGGEIIANYPESPRKSTMKAADVAAVANALGLDVHRVGGTKSAPIFRMTVTA